MTEGVQDEEPEAPETLETVPLKGKRKSFNAVRRELSEEDLSSPAVQKLLLDEVDRLDNEIAEAKIFKGQYYEADKKNGILEQKFKTFKSFEFLSACSIIGGSIIFGFVPGIWSDQPTASIILIVGVIFVVGGLVAKVIKL